MNYNIDKDLILIRQYFNQTQEQFAKTLGVERTRIARVESKESYPRYEFMNIVYNYCFNQGLRLNIQKELLYKDDIRNNHILLTHASKNEIIGDIDYQYGRINNDFGKGFYCSDSYQNSLSFVSRFKDSCVYFIDFDPTGLKGYKFDVNRDWMLTIAYFRGTLNKYKNHIIIKNLIEPILNLDYIIAPIADNRMFQIIDTFIEGEITDEQCRHCLAATNLGYQYVFINNNAVKNLKILERCFISNSEKEYYQKEQINFLNTGNDKAKLARIKYKRKGKGKYIEEILK